MTLSFKPRHLKRYGEIGRLLLKYGQSDIFKPSSRFSLSSNGRAAPCYDEPADATGQGQGTPEELTNDLEAMGPTYVKLGQILSSRPDLVPDRYMKALSRLQDRVKPFSFGEVEKVVERELCVRISKAFTLFDSEPLAAASLGQVHRAILRDGRDVVVKVQRPGIRERIAADFEVIEELVDFLQKHSQSARRYQIDKILDEFQRTLEHELDYQREAANLRLIAENLKGFPNIRIPLPIAGYTTHSVLTMEYVSGLKITKLTPLARTELNGAALADELFKAYLQQVLIDGLFHADPHPGNVYLTEDNEVALLDLGMVGRVAPAMQDKLIRLLLAVAEGNSDEAATIAIQVSETTTDFDEVDFRRQIGSLVAEQKDNALCDIEVGSTILQVSRTAAENALFVPTELTMLGKTLLQLDQVGRTLDPQFNPNDAVRRHVTDILNQRFKTQFTASKLYSSTLEIKEFIGTLPAKLGKLIDNLGDPQIQVNVRERDTRMFLEGVHRIANRITAGLILAALIVGAALLMRVPTEFTIFGYPGLAIICFLLASSGAAILLVNIFTQDHRNRRKAKEC